MKLSEVDFDTLRVGLPVISATGKTGKVAEKWRTPDRFDDRYVRIEWQDGSESTNWFVWMDLIEVAE